MPALLVHCSTMTHFFWPFFPDPKQKPKPKAIAPLPGRSKFIDPESPLVPQQLILWSKALTKIDQNPELRPDGVLHVLTLPYSSLSLPRRRQSHTWRASYGIVLPSSIVFPLQLCLLGSCLLKPGGPFYCQQVMWMSRSRHPLSSSGGHR